MGTKAIIVSSFLALSYLFKECLDSTSKTWLMREVESIKTTLPSACFSAHGTNCTDIMTIINSKGRLFASRMWIFRCSVWRSVVSFLFYFYFFFKCVVPGNVDMWRMLKGMSPIVFVSDSKYFSEVLRGSNNIEICM